MAQQGDSCFFCNVFVTVLCEQQHLYMYLYVGLESSQLR